MNNFLDIFIVSWTHSFEQFASCFEPFLHFFAEFVLKIGRKDYDWNFSGSFFRLKQRQYKNDSYLKKIIIILKFPRFFAHRIGEQKSAANLKLIDFSSKQSRSYILLALVPSASLWKSTEINSRYRTFHSIDISTDQSWRSTVETPNTEEASWDVAW